MKSVLEGVLLVVLAVVVSVSAATLAGCSYHHCECDGVCPCHACPCDACPSHRAPKVNSKPKADEPDYLPPRPGKARASSAASK